MCETGKKEKKKGPYSSCRLLGIFCRKFGIAVFIICLYELQKCSISSSCWISIKKNIGVLEGLMVIPLHCPIVRIGFRRSWSPFTTLGTPTIASWRRGPCAVASARCGTCTRPVCETRLMRITERTLEGTQWGQKLLFGEPFGGGVKPRSTMHERVKFWGKFNLGGQVWVCHLSAVFPTVLWWFFFANFSFVCVFIWYQHMAESAPYIWCWFAWFVQAKFCVIFSAIICV